MLAVVPGGFEQVAENSTSFIIKISTLQFAFGTNSAFGSPSPHPGNMGLFPCSIVITVNIFLVVSARNCRNTSGSPYQWHVGGGVSIRPNAAAVWHDCKGFPVPYFAAVISK